MRYSDSVVLPAPRDRVWALTTDLEGLADVVPAITAVERLEDGEVRPGTRVRIRQRGMPPRIWTVTRCDEPAVFEWATSLLGIGIVAEHRLEPADDGTRQTLSLLVDGPGASVLARVAGGRLQAALEEENAGFAAALGG